MVVLKGACTCQHLVENGSKGPDVSAKIDFINNAYVGMVEGGHRLSLPNKTGLGLLIQYKLSREKLEGHITLEPSVFCLMNNPHPAAADLFDDLVPVGEKSAPD